MKRAGWFTCPAVTLALAGMALPQLSAADLPPRPASSAATATRPVATTNTPAVATPAPAAVADIALSDGGTLHGQVVDPQGIPLGQRDVIVRQQDRTLAATRTDTDGRFAISGLAGGVYQVVAADSVAVFRLWSAGTAPPAALGGALIVAGNALVRGQGPAGGVRRFFSSPWVLAGLLAAAIATPIALSNRDKISTS